MLNISSSQPLSWPSASPMPAVQVHPVPAVGAAQPSRDAQTDSGRQGQKPQGTQALPNRTSSEPAAGAPSAQPAPLLPRGHGDTESPTVADKAAEELAQTEQRLEDEQKAREKAEQKVQLKEVLASVWKASAAVVDVVLGKDGAEAVSAVSETARANAVQAVSGTDVATPARDLPKGSDAQADLPGIEPIPAALRRELEPVAYTEQGASSWAPVEAGSLISQRV